MKIKIILLLVISMIHIHISTAVFQRGVGKYYDREMGTKATPNQPWNFEIYDKYLKHPVQIYIVSSDGNLNFATLLNFGSKVRLAGINTKGSFSIKLIKADLAGAVPSEIFIQPNSQRNTIYLTLDAIGDKLILRPQTGTFMGLSGKTDSGLLLNKSTNVKANEVVPAMQSMRVP